MEKITFIACSEILSFKIWFALQVKWLVSIWYEFLLKDFTEQTFVSRGVLNPSIWLRSYSFYLVQLQTFLGVNLRPFRYHGFSVSTDELMAMNKFSRWWRSQYLFSSVKSFISKAIKWTEPFHILGCSSFWQNSCFLQPFFTISIFHRINIKYWSIFTYCFFYSFRTLLQNKIKPQCWIQIRTIQ